MAGVKKVGNALRSGANPLICVFLLAALGVLVYNAVFYQCASARENEEHIKTATPDYREILVNLQGKLDDIEQQVKDRKDIEHQEAKLIGLHDKSDSISMELKGINGNLSEQTLKVRDLGAELDHLNKEIQVAKAHQMKVNVEQSDVKVILLTYMRSGSTFIGELLNQNPDVAYWFEPLGGVYSHMYFAQQGIYPVDITHYANGAKRDIPEFEHRILADNLLALLNCDYENVAVETMFSTRGLDDFDGIKETRYSRCLKPALKAEGFNYSFAPVVKHMCEKKVKFPCKIANFTTCRNMITAIQASGEHLEQAENLDDVYGFLNRSKCMAKLQNVLRRCVEPVRKLCRVTTKAIKVIRLTMDTVGRILQLNPNVKVIHLLRDPRGILNSRRKIGLLSRLKRPENASKMVTEANILCHKMIADIKTRVALEKNYPNNFLEVRYESVAEAPTAKYKEIYQFLGIKPSFVVENWISESTNASSNRPQQAFGTVRSNSTETAYSWRKDINDDVMQRLSDACKDVLIYLKEVHVY